MSRHRAITPSTTRTRVSALAILIVAGASITAVTTPPTASAASIDQEFTAPTLTWPASPLDDRDAAFVAALDAAGVGYLSAQTAVTAALAVCLLRDRGAELGAARAAVGVTGWQPTSAGYFTGAATAAYCPDVQATPTASTSTSPTG